MALGELALSQVDRVQDGEGGASIREHTPDSTPVPQAGEDYARTNGSSATSAKPAANPPVRNTKAALKKFADVEDAELIRRFQSGEEQAYFVIYERRQKEIFAHCLRMCNLDRDKASDAFQDTFVKIYTKAHLFKDATNGRAWLYRIATNTCLNMLRHEKRHATEELDVSFESSDPRMQPDFNEEQTSLKQQLEKAIAKLPMELREPFLLRELEEFSYEEISEQLGISVAACRQKVYRAKQLLRDSLEEVVNPEPEPPPKEEKKWKLFGGRS